jgi:hypothetical protein
MGPSAGYNSLSSSSSSWWMPEGLHGKHLPSFYVVRDFKQQMMTTRVNGATDALSMGPTARYNSLSIFVKFNIGSAMIILIKLPVVVHHNCLW